MQTYQDADHASRMKAQQFVIAELCEAARKHEIPMDDLDVASECADYLLAGIDTTSDTLMFLIWSLSLFLTMHMCSSGLSKNANLYPNRISWALQ